MVFGIVLYYIFLCEIHPFYNGNGTVALLFSQYYMNRYGYTTSIIEFFDELYAHEQFSFFKQGIAGKYDPVYDLFFQKIRK